MASTSPSGFSQNPHPPVPLPAPTIQQIPSKSHLNCLSKSLIIVLIILAIPLFPSQAPDFISESIPTEFWEIFHLLFIGIAVSYGLFGRKTVETVTDQTAYSRNDVSNSCMSGISDLSSIFEDDISGSVEQNCGNMEYLQLQNGDNQFLGKNRFAVEESKNVRSFASDKIYEGNGEKVTQAWCSPYSKGGPLVVVSNGIYSLDESSDLKPLNLPVRSIRSTVVDNERSEMKHRGEFSIKYEAMGVDDDAKVVKIRGVVPKNSEKKFDEVAGPSFIPWRSRSVKMENGGEMINFEPPAHCRPQSVGQIEFEHLNSPELANTKAENGDRKWDFWQAVDSVSDSKIGPLNVEATLNGAKAQPFSVGSASEMNKMNNLHYNLKNNGDLGEESEVEKGKRGIKSTFRGHYNLKNNGDLGEESGVEKGKRGSDAKSTTLAKVLSRATSVRTKKPNRYVVDIKGQSSNQDFSVKKGMQAIINHKNQESDSIFPMPKPKPILHDEGKDDIGHGSVTDSEDDTRSEFDKSSDEDDSGYNLVSDAELGSEVDRKAGEFIAKFKEQIRLQKTSSVKGDGAGW